VTELNYIDKDFINIARTFKLTQLYSYTVI